MRQRSVWIVVFEGVQAIDVFGPADAFYFANYVAAQSGVLQPPYEVALVAKAAGPVGTAAGPKIVADLALSTRRRAPDVLLVSGGAAVQGAAEDQALVRALRRLADRSGEVGSICTGAVLLAAAGLLDGRRATTHWALAEQLKAAHPSVDVDDDRIFVYDGVWTSAGVTAGIDLAIELIRSHHGSQLATGVARHMVVYLQRSGGQRQHSPHLDALTAADPRITELAAYIADHPAADLSIEALAERVHMSPRSFQRLFRREAGVSPGRYVERARIGAARRLLEQSEAALEPIAEACGFGTVETFHRAFRRIVGVTPTDYRRTWGAVVTPA